MGGFTHLGQQMIQSGADVNVVDASGLSLLLQAVVSSNQASTSFLLQHGADITARSPQGETALELAVKEGGVGVAEALCQAGADTGASSTGEPPIWMALEKEAEDLASVLVRHGADTDGWGPGPEGCEQTLLHRAIDENKEEVAVFLIRAGCDLNSPRRGGDEDGEGPIQLATQWGQEGVVTALIEHGADLNRGDNQSKTALHHAIENGQQGIINLLLGCPGIDLTARDKAGLSPFSAAMTFKNNTAAKVILELEPGAAEQPDSRGKNFLHTAIIKSDLESLLLLISINVNVHSKTTDSNKLAPILLAVQVGNEMMVRNLLLAEATSKQPECSSQRAVCPPRLQTTRAEVLCMSSPGSLRRMLWKCSSYSSNVCQSTTLTDLMEKATLLCCWPILKAMDLCRALVKRGAILGTMNKANENIFNCPVATKQLLFRLLDLLSAEPGWGEGDVCEECQAKFGLTTRRHHCRHCGRLLCSKCSAKET